MRQRQLNIRNHFFILNKQPCLTLYDAALGLQPALAVHVQSCVFPFRFRS